MHSPSYTALASRKTSVLDDIGYQETSYPGPLRSPRHPSIRHLANVGFNILLERFQQPPPLRQLGAWRLPVVLPRGAERLPFAARVALGLS